MTAQWQGLLQNLGEWQGSFTQFSAQGEELQDVPSALSLRYADADQNVVRLTLQRFPEGKPVHEISFDYRYPGPAPQQVPFLPTGAFSQGSVQWSPVSEFGAELSLIYSGAVAGVSDHRRLRLVQRYAFGSELTGITLIRETRLGSSKIRSSALSISDLIGTWQGEAISYAADASVGETVATHIEVSEADGVLSQQLRFAEQTLASVGRIQGSRILFDSGSLPMQLLLLPGGASSLCPLQIRAGVPFFLEVGWLIAPGLRYRLIRNYNAQGEWVSLVQVIEAKIM